MEIVYFISVDDLTKYSTVNTNVEPAIMRQAILDAQEIDLYQELGGQLYNKLSDLIISGMTSEPNYQELFDDYVYKVVIRYASVRVLNLDRFKIYNKGVNTMSSNNSEKVEFDEFLHFKQDLTNTAEFVVKRMKDYLTENASKFPEYTHCKVDGTLGATNNDYFSGIMFQ